MSQRVAILGASNKQDRYSYKAFKMLQEYGHKPYPIHPSLDKVEDSQVYKSLSDIPDEIDTLTMYVGPQLSRTMADEIIALKPRRVIFNPGSENSELAKNLQYKGIETFEACTLVLLRTGQF